jgi:hypothetical protein
MVSRKAARAATALAVSDPRNVEQLAGPLNVHASKSDTRTQLAVGRWLAFVPARRPIQPYSAAGAAFLRTVTRDRLSIGSAGGHRLATHTEFGQ